MKKILCHVAVLAPSLAAPLARAQITPIKARASDPTLHAVKALTGEETLAPATLWDGTEPIVCTPNLASLDAVTGDEQAFVGLVLRPRSQSRVQQQGLVAIH